MFKKLYLPVISALLLAGCTNDSPEKYFNEAQEKFLRVQYGAYLEKKPDRARTDIRFDPEMAEIYTNRSVYYTHKRVNQDADGTYKVLLLRKENWSLQNKHRMIGISFKLESDSIRSVDPIFYTPAVSKEEAEELGEMLYAEWIKTGNVDKYFDQRDKMEWPNSEVFWDKNTETWEIKANSSLKELERFSK